MYHFDWLIFFKDYGVGKIDEYLTDHKKWAKNAKEYVKKYELLKSSNVEHTIIIVNNEEKTLTGNEKNQYTYASGIDLLIEYFVREAIKFKVVICYDKKGFIDAIKNSEGDNLWIIGHGWRHGIDFGNNKECPFCEFSRFKYKKKFIAQLHCCNTEGKTLWEYLSDRPGIFSEGYRHVIQNREDVKKWIKQQSPFK